MENYKNLVLQNEIGNISMIRPISKDGISIIDTYPLDVVERLGKYQFVYDYKVSNFWDTLLQSSSILLPNNTGIKKEEIKQSSELPMVSVPKTAVFSSQSQVGTFSKGNVVNVIRFEGSNAIIENPNYKETAPDAPKSFWSGLNTLQNQKEFSIPKDYLQKVDDSVPVTIETGINFGANPKPQPISIIKPIPQVSSEVILEENATFVLNSDFQYISGYGSSFCSPDGMCTADMSPKYSILKAGTKVTGRLFKTITTPQKNIFTPASVMPNAVEKDFLAVKGYGNTGSINIPIEYLTREVTTNTNNNNGNVVPVANDNKNLLMIVGAFLVGYVLFSKETPSS